MAVADNQEEIIDRNPSKYRLLLLETVVFGFLLSIAGKPSTSVPQVNQALAMGIAHSAGAHRRVLGGADSGTQAASHFCI